MSRFYISLYQFFYIYIFIINFVLCISTSNNIKNENILPINFCLNKNFGWILNIFEQ